jgi:hypothetical protein
MTATFKTDWRASLRTPRSREGARRTAILVGSVAIHAGVLGLIGLGLIDTAPDERLVQFLPPVYVEMEPRPLLNGETARIPRAAPARSTDAPVQSRSASREVAPPRLKEEDEDRPAPPSPHVAGVPAAGAPAPPAEANPWAYHPESLGAAVGRTMRTGAGGCRTMDGHLSAAEQAVCDQRFIDGAVAAGQRHPPGERTLTPSEQRRQDAFAAQLQSQIGRQRLDRVFTGLRVSSASKKKGARWRSSAGRGGRRPCRPGSDGRR